MEIPAKLDADHRRVTVGDEPMIFHCHHYNTFLQQSILDADYIDSRPFLVGAANEVAYAQLTKIFAEHNVEDTETRRKLAQDIYQWAGFGRVDLSKISDGGGALTTEHSHYSLAWKTKFGEHDKPVDYFTTGWVAGACAAIHNLTQGHFSAKQTKCMAMGASANEFEFAPANGDPNYRVFEAVGAGALTQHNPVQVEDNPVDYDGVFEAVCGLPLVGDDTGSIPAFGVILTRHYANYYNRISFEFMNELSNRFEDQGREIAEELLVEAGHVCAFNTFGGIMTSPEWDALIKPALETKTHWVHGITAVVNALGWGRWQVTEVSEQSADFTIHDDYESVGYLAMYDQSEHPVSFLHQGAVMGVMDLVYIGEVEAKPDFTPDFYEKLFKSPLSYHGTCKESQAMGKTTTTFAVTAPSK